MGGICWQSVIQNCMLIPLFKRRISSNVAATSVSSILPSPMRIAPCSFQREGCKTCRLKVFPFATDLPLLCAGLGDRQRHPSSMSKATFLNRIALHYFLPRAPISDPGRKDIRVLLIGGAIYGGSHVHDYTTSWILADIPGGRSHARGLAAGVPLSLPNAPLMLGHCTTQTFGPPPLKKISFPFLQLCSYFSELTVREGAADSGEGVQGEKEEGSLLFSMILVKSYSQDIQRKRANSRAKIRVWRRLIRSHCSPKGQAAMA